ncbi:hypothetical protein AX15_005625 [Amanita polypyramis BW_CC]|nr:hypothetical protein AX15_005625 [Amanita polypyramis BW_CC]
MVIRRYGRLPVLFWSQVLALGFLIGATFAPNLNTFAAMRCLTAFFGTTPQVTGLYIIADMYPFHLQARQLNFWTMGFIVSPFLSPFACGFLAAKQYWRWSYGVGCFYSIVVVLLIAFFVRETMYDRTVKPIPEAPTTGIRSRIETLVGITGYRMSKYRVSWGKAIWSSFDVAWRPHILSLLIFEGAVFGFGIGINVTTVVFLGSPPPLGFGLAPLAVAGMYATPIVSVVLGELAGRFTNEWIQNYTIKKNKGVFESESRLWPCYIAVPLFICGFLVIGASFQKHLSLGAVIMGWGIAQLSIMINTVAVYTYLNDSFPRHQGEVSALANLARILGGFAVPYFQVPWASRNGALQTYGVEAA